jgi:colicin import membrane protein
MGALASAASGIAGAVSAVRTVVNTIENPSSLNPLNTQSALLAQQQSLALKQLQQKQAVDTENLTAQTALDQQQLAAQSASDTDQRQSALRAAVARQRASYGASGISPDDGSSQAVLLGMFDDNDQVQQDADRIDSLRSAALDQNLTDQANVDVLQRTQLQQQQKLQQVAEGF